MLSVMVSKAFKEVKNKLHPVGRFKGLVSLVQGSNVQPTELNWHVLGVGSLKWHLFMHHLTFWAQMIQLESIEHVYKRILKYQNYKQLDS